MPLKIHIATIKEEMDAEFNLFKADTLKYTEELLDKFIKF